MEGDGGDGGVKTFEIRGERNCLVINVKPGRIICNDCYKVVDNGDCVDLVMEGKIAELPVDAERASRAGVVIDRCVWMTGPDFKSEKKIENGKLVMYTPPCISSFPKKEIDAMTAEQALKKINLDFLDFTCVETGKVGVPMNRQRLEKMYNVNRETQVVLAKEEEEDDSAAAAGYNKQDLDEDAPNKEDGEEAKKSKRVGSKKIKKRKQTKPRRGSEEADQTK